MTLFCGIDWADAHHDVALVNEEGALVASARITNDLDGLSRLLELLADAGERPTELVRVAIATSKTSTFRGAVALTLGFRRG